MNNPEKMTRSQLISLANGHKSMIAGLQKQLKAALESNVTLYTENKTLREAAAAK